MKRLIVSMSDCSAEICFFNSRFCAYISLINSTPFCCMGESGGIFLDGSNLGVLLFMISLSIYRNTANGKNNRNGASNNGVAPNERYHAATRSSFASISKPTPPTCSATAKQRCAAATSNCPPKPRPAALSRLIIGFQTACVKMRGYCLWKTLQGSGIFLTCSHNSPKKYSAAATTAC